MATTENHRSIRLLIRSRPAVYGESPGYAYVLGGSAKEADPSALPVPGPTLVLKKGEPVAINLVNRTHEAAAVHWHGIELESFPDGVPGWSGAGDQILPAIRPGDSLTVRFTPPRAGTFMYHSHFNELQQISSGLYGAIVVLEPGQRYDPDKDRILLFSDPDPAAVVGVDRRGSSPMLNGHTNAQPIELRAGETYRFRIINIRSNYTVAVELLDGDRVLEWRRVAKDGADLPASQATLGPAFLSLGVGEIHDVAFTPQKPGTFTLRFGFPPALRPPPIPPVVLPPPPTMVDVHVK